MNYYKIIISLIFVTFLVTGCAQPGKKVKSFKHNTPLIKTDVKEFGKSELEKDAKMGPVQLKQTLLNYKKEKKYHRLKRETIY